MSQKKAKSKRKKTKKIKTKKKELELENQNLETQLKQSSCTIQELEQQVQTLTKKIKTKKKELELENQNLETQLKQSSCTIQELEQQVQTLTKEIGDLKRNKLDEKIKNSQHPEEFWSEIAEKVMKDTESIKALLNNQTFSIHDVDPQGNTLLHYAATIGNYEIAQLSINLGADTAAKNSWGETPSDNAQETGSFAVLMLLLLDEMGTNMGERVKQRGELLTKQNGIVQNILGELQGYDDTTKGFFEDTLLDLMNKILQNKSIFSDDLLCLCWKLEAKKGNVLKSDLWKTIATIFQEILENDNKRDWTFLKKCLLPSNIWFQDIQQNEENEEEPSYLYFELLKMVKKKSIQLTKELERNITMDTAKNKDGWKQLIEYDISCNKLTTLSPLNGAEPGTSVARQDTVPNGLRSQYNKDTLHRNASTDTFDGAVFYDRHIYLSTLSLLSQSVDAEFQRSVKDIFNVNDKDSTGYVGTVDEDDHKYSQDELKRKRSLVWYKKGPVKLLNRARNKVESDYTQEAFPTSACILDLNRCSFVFADIATLLKGLQHFVNKVWCYQSGSIIGIVRIKNGFKEYIKTTQYADIKLNVLIRGESNNIVGEVQFLLKTMESFKKRAHNLYSIEREEEFMEKSASKILPILLDDEIQRKFMAVSGDVKGLQQWMVYMNKTASDLVGYWS
eukprot:128311_1